MTSVSPGGPRPPASVLEVPWHPVGTLTTCSLIWMHRDFFLTAAIPVVKVFRMLVALRSASCARPPGLQWSLRAPRRACPAQKQVADHFSAGEGRPRREAIHLAEPVEAGCPSCSLRCPTTPT